MKSPVFTFVLFCLTFSFSVAQNDAFLGVHSNSVSPAKAKKLRFEQPYGAYITNVLGNTAAERAGLQPFDYLYRIDDYTFEDHVDLHDVLENYQSGDRATLYYIRNGAEERREVVFGRESEADERDRDDDEDPFLGIQQNHDRASRGVPVDIVKNSTAEAMGLEDGDVITEINGYLMVDWHDLRTAIDATEVGQPLTVTYRRGGKVTTVTQPVQSLAVTKVGANHGTYNYSYSYNMGDEHGPKASAAEPDSERVDLSDMEVEMEDMPAEEAEQMEEALGIEMPVVQNLRIEQLNIFPNPSAGRFNLTFDLPDEGATAIRIFNASGRLVYSYDLGNFSGTFNDQIDLGDQPAGTYYVMIRQGAFSVSKKVVIARA